MSAGYDSGSVNGGVDVGIGGGRGLTKHRRSGSDGDMDDYSGRDRRDHRDHQRQQSDEEELNGQAKNSQWSLWLQKHPKVDKGLDYLKQFFYFLIAVAIFAATGAAIGATMYVAIVAMPAIAASFSAAAGLAALPQALILGVAALMLVGTIAVAWKWLEMHYKLAYNKIVTLSELPFYILFLPLMALKESSFASVAKYLSLLVGSLFIDDKSLDKAAQDDDEEEEEEAPSMYPSMHPFSSKDGKYTRTQKYHLLALLASLGLGIYLAVQVAPFVMAAAAASVGLPFSVTLLLGAFTAVAIIAMTYQLLALGITLSNIYHTRNALKKKKDMDWKYANIMWSNVGYTLAAAVGVAAAAYASSLFFPVLVNTLTPVLGAGMATFAAVAVSVTLALTLMYFLPNFCKFVATGGMKMVPARFKSKKDAIEHQEPEPAQDAFKWWHFRTRFNKWQEKRAAKTKTTKGEEGETQGEELTRITVRQSHTHQQSRVLESTSSSSFASSSDKGQEREPQKSEKTAGAHQPSFWERCCRGRKASEDQNDDASQPRSRRLSQGGGEEQ